VDVETIVLDPALEPLGIGALLDQVPDGPLQDMLRMAGQDLDVSSPVVDVTDGSVHVTSAPLLVRVVRPDAPQGVEVHVGHLDVLAERLPNPPAFEDAPLAAPRSPAALPALPGAASLAVSPPVPPAGGVAVIDGDVIDEVRELGSVPWRGTAAVLALAVAWWRVANARRDRWPTAHWTLTHLERAGRRFRAAYLRW
jgi:hypothetical protein